MSPLVLWSRRTSVHPAGAVTRAWVPVRRTFTTASSVVPVLTPSGFEIVRTFDGSAQALVEPTRFGAAPPAGAARRAIPRTRTAIWRSRFICLANRLKADGDCSLDDVS